MLEDGEVAEGYPSRNTETAGLLRDQFVKTPRSSRWYDMHVEKKDCGRSTVCSWSPEAAKLNSAFSRVARCNLPTAPPSQALSQDILRRWERAAREQSVLCNQAAGLSRCLTWVQRAMSTQLKNLHVDKGKGKSYERKCSKLFTNWSIWLHLTSQSPKPEQCRTCQKVCSLVLQTSLLRVGTVTWTIYMWVLNRTHSLHCILLPFIFNHFSRTSFPLRLKRKWPKVKRGVLLASLAGNPVVSILMLPMTSHLVNRTQSLLSQLEANQRRSWQVFHLFTETGQGF